MKTRGYIDLYLPRKWAYHIKIVLASVIIVLLFRFFSNTPIKEDGTILMFALLIIQFEFFIWLGSKFFANIPYTSTKDFAKRTIIRLILFFAMAFIISIVIYMLTLVIYFLIKGLDLNMLIPHVLNEEYKGFLIGAGSGYILGSMVFFYFQWIDALKREQKLREEKLVFQYETLKNQVNPHFLFNSLNTLSSLVTKDVNLSEEYIVKLSSIYRYILENKDLDNVNLQKEIKFVKDYFYLQKVRDNGKIDLKIEIKDPGKYLILPISLQLLVENAFKHNIATREDPLIVLIQLDEQQKVISVTNNLKPKMQMDESSNIGLANLAERNKLITGREIEVVKSENTFTVHVPLKLMHDESTNH